MTANDDVRPLIERAIFLLLSRSGAPESGSGTGAAVALREWVKAHTANPGPDQDSDPWTAWFRAKTGLARLYVTGTHVFHAPTRTHVELPAVVAGAIHATDNVKAHAGHALVRPWSLPSAPEAGRPGPKRNKERPPRKRTDIVKVDVTCPLCRAPKSVWIYPSAAMIAKVSARLCRACGAIAQKEAMKRHRKPR